MNINHEKYTIQENKLPSTGKHIIGQYDDESIIVYQAYNSKIANYAVAHQTFGGSFSFNRMTWIKPNFLWMMYRAGWASKENQERILAIRIKKEGFIEILEEAVHSTFKPNIYSTHEAWKEAMNHSNVRLQWDPAHDPYGEKKDRKAIQLGLKGSTLEKFCQEWILEISDITDFVKAEKLKLDTNGIEELTVPVERTFEVQSLPLNKKLEMSGLETE
ncbi:hypothetical protein AVL50_29325 [Flammeovirga sp. SJP92]|nr:hypothetical protein AVL50_29325 [Flammeovirga sp. SJP92]